MDSVIKFGTDGWRAIMCEDFIVRNVEFVAQAIANRINEQGMSDMGLVVGYDSRFFSDRFAEACADVFAGNAIPVYIAPRPMPTPLTAFAIKHVEAAGGVMITASHNPAYYNGIKFIPHYAGPASKEITDDIERKIESVVEAGVVSKIDGGDRRDLDVLPKYLEHLESLIDFERLRESGLKIGLDPLYGAGCGIVDAVFANAGCDRIEIIHNNRDPLFGGGNPDPSRERLEELKRLVIDEGMDLGLALDGDADRFGAIDYDGSYLTANEIIAIIARHLLKNKGRQGSIVRTVATTHMLDKIAKSAGCKLVETPVGFKYIAERMLAEQVVIGGEESGGLSIGGHIPEKDGIIADLLLAEVVAYERKPLTEILAEMKREHGDFRTKRLDVHLAPEAKKEMMESLAGYPPSWIGGSAVSEVKLTDGVKYLLENGDWVLARPSGTEPLVRIYLESKTGEGLEALETFARDIIP